MPRIQRMPASPRRADYGAMHIRDWPACERPREKLLSRGPSVLSDAELLAIFLGSGTAGRDAVATARDMLQAHGPLRSLLDSRRYSWTPAIVHSASKRCSTAVLMAPRYIHECWSSAHWRRARRP